MKRGDIVTVAAPGDYGKPRPAVVIQSDRMRETTSVLVAQMTSDLVDARLYRLPIEPTPDNNLKLPTQVMVSKLIAMPVHKIGPAMGRLTGAELLALDSLLMLMLGLAG